MRSSYLDYSMSVIIGRALPDVRDGLKPVHRRILYAMADEGLRSRGRFAKCAGVVGEVLKKYHPHGDSAVYDALVRMAQPWNMRYPLINGQGNFGSVDGDPPAAYRYTESKMQQLAEELLADIDKDTVSFEANFDGSTEEPTVLPAAFPNLLVNGSDGIAVGMATKIPPHNLGEIIDAVIALSHDPGISIDRLMEIVPGPDFPTAGTIYGRAGVRDAYHTGRGKVIVRGQANFEEKPNGRESIIIDELPFQVNKARLIKDIARLVKDKRIEGISALRDESDREGMRIVIELKRDAVKEVVLNHLFKHTALQSTFGVILLAIVHNRPRVLTLKEMLQHYLQHRRDVTIRRTRYLLRKARQRKHIVDGLLIALDNLDEVIKIIRSSQTDTEARERLMSRFELSEVQARQILDMRLRRLTGMQRLELEAELAELIATIAELEAILGDEGRLMDVIRGELMELRERYVDERRTRFEESSAEVDIMDLIAEEDQVVTLSVNGYIKRTSHSEYSEQRRGGFGKRGMRTRNEDSVQDIFIANTHSDLLAFTTQGLVYKVPVYRVPEVGRDARGIPIVNLAGLEPGDEIASVIPVPDIDRDDIDLLFCSRMGRVKRTKLSLFRNLRTNGLRAYGAADGDSLLSVAKARTDQHVLIVTRNGLSIRFAGINDKGELEVRHMGRTARGVRGIDLRDNDDIASMLVLDDVPGLKLLTVTENGYGKRTPLDRYRVQGRGGKGVIDIVTDNRNGRVCGAVPVTEDDRIMLITDTGRVIKMRVDDIRETDRNTKGVTLMRVEDNERVVGVTRVVEAEDDDELETSEVAAAETDAASEAPEAAPSPEGSEVAPSPEAPATDD
ncbi:MAG: DNA gyrase subunit A [Deltaproteobacteria bacterium]|nr:DNA gyrase subunit A [Deltaproteobacteria bacterium]HCH65394.1 DNA gyrase subunit A [Deltaproteobacteria bacterium]